MSEIFQPTVVIYYRPLEETSEAAMQVLERVRPFEKFILKEVDVGQDPRAEALYGDQAPVTTINGRVAFRGRINEDQFIRRLKAARLDMIREDQDRIDRARRERAGRNGERSRRAW